MIHSEFSFTTAMALANRHEKYMRSPVNTDAERAALKARDDALDDLARQHKAAIAAAILAEREACALMAAHAGHVELFTKISARPAP